MRTLYQYMYKMFLTRRTNVFMIGLTYTSSRRCSMLKDSEQHTKDHCNVLGRILNHLANRYRKDEEGGL